MDLEFVYIGINKSPSDVLLNIDTSRSKYIHRVCGRPSGFCFWSAATMQMVAVVERGVLSSNSGNEKPCRQGSIVPVGRAHHHSSAHHHSHLTHPGPAPWSFGPPWSPFGGECFRIWLLFQQMFLLSFVRRYRGWHICREGIIKMCRKQCLDCTGVSGSHMGHVRKNTLFEVSSVSF